MKKYLTLSLLSCGIFTGSVATCKDMQIAFVDSFKAMRECKDGEVVGRELDAMRDKFSKEIQQEAQKLAQKENALKSKVCML